jgi:hemerythrin superfamily protein
MADVFEVLKTDHQEVKSMLDQLGGGDPQQRQKLAERLVTEESKHEAAEQAWFWPAVRESVDGGDGLADTALHQEAEGAEVLGKLDKAKAGSAEFDELVSTFTKAALEHIAFEEDQVWPKLKSVLGTQTKNDLGAKVEQAKKTASTRPHPDAS